MAFVALLVVLVGLTATAESGGLFGSYGSSERPSLRLAGLAPFAVEGRGFKASERVRIAAGKVRRTVTAGRRGRFVARFGRLDLCDEVTVVAVGSKGTRATIAFEQLEQAHCLDPGTVKAGRAA